jgi:hypothetical protein
VLAAALAAGAFALVTDSIWQLADALDTVHQTLLGAGAVAGMITWLVIGHGLWDRPSQRRSTQQAALFNAATTLTLLLGILCMYAALFAANVVAGLILVDSDAWLASSASMMGGAVGSGMESDEHVRLAAYGRRGDPD